ncbi:hypothetical protein ONE63_010471 [Megalurothrips usitatus]|uniref:Protein CUSTOS n=1 Tax=Megalurothrips usitatus TaxID=439358 RepID=A0AAV7XCZ3_9NEOP|nr:hypothetical protein ONE63_010471 [Megalurothrips usitatus]
MPSSSSSEEDLSKFQEAADSVLYNDTLFTKKPAPEDKSEIASLPSLRHVEEEVDRIHNELRVTPSFQKHVAKHLSQFIDNMIDLNLYLLCRQIDISETSNDDAETTNTRNILKGKRNRNCNDASAGQTGVRLFGASAVFLSELNIAIDTTRRKKRKRKIASFSTDRDSSSEDSDSDSMQKLSAAAVSPDWILSGAATKGWAVRNGKVEKCTINKSGKLVSVNDDVSRGYESLNEMSSGSKCSKKSDLQQVKDDLAVGKLCRKDKPLHLESELAASFSSVVSIGSDSPGEVPSKRKKKRGKNERRRLKKEQYSEDAATETTEVEDAVEERKKKVKKSKKKSKRRRTEEKGEKGEVIMEEISGVPSLPVLDEDVEPRKKKKKKKRKRDSDDDRRVHSFLRKKGDSSLAISKKKICKKKMSRKVSHLAEDLSKLMVTPDDVS